jgi:hypothetical protein
MQRKFLLAIPVILMVTLACGLTNGIQQIKSVVTQIPGMLTSAPTAMGAVETAAAGESSAFCGTPTPGGMGINIVNARAVLLITGMVNFTDGTTDGKPSTTLTLTSSGASAYPAISNGLSVEFVGDSCDMSLVKVTIPRTDQQETVDEALSVLNLTLAASMPLDVQIGLLSWVNDNYESLPVSGQSQTTISGIQFTMQRTSTDMILEAVPTS